MRIIRVPRCGECPFQEARQDIAPWFYVFCTHPKFGKERSRAIDSEKQESPPEWCPLEDAPVESE